MELLARAALGLGIAIADYNSKLTDNFKDIQEATVAYMSIVKHLKKEGLIEEEKLPLFFSLVGEAWGAIVLR
jgi:hypothetical protein